MSHYESARLCQNDVVASHYESSALVVPAGGPMLLAGLTDTLQGVAVRRWQLTAVDGQEDPLHIRLIVNLTLDVSIFTQVMYSLTASTPIPSIVMDGQGQYAGRP